MHVTLSLRVPLDLAGKIKSYTDDLRKHHASIFDRLLEEDATNDRVAEHHRTSSKITPHNLIRMLLAEKLLDLDNGYEADELISALAKEGVRRGRPSREDRAA